MRREEQTGNVRALLGMKTTSRLRDEVLSHLSRHVGKSLICQGTVAGGWRQVHARRAFLFFFFVNNRHGPPFNFALPTEDGY